MCGFIVTNKKVGIGELLNANRFSYNRGPDKTIMVEREGIWFVHNLLHITGQKVLQPFKKGDFSWVFNGEIYNYKDWGDFPTDGECIVEAYKDAEIEKLDGEYAIVVADFQVGKVRAYTDCFATKPLWHGREGNEFCFASYKSSVEALGFKAYRIGHHEAVEYDMEDGRISVCHRNPMFDLKQHKDTYGDWITAFENSIRKRTRGVGRGMFMGLSSGYDSGAIACEMGKQKVKFETYTVMATETRKIINKRVVESGGTLLRPSVSDYKRVQKYIRNNCEDFKYRDKFNKYNIKKDKASVGLGMICELAQKKDQRVYFSGQGADEIMSDYGFNGRRMMSHSEFGGKFPKKLEGFFPWHSFYDGTQIKYLNKEEYVAGCYGIETRYPYLDVDLVQEFLWLTPELKNKNYKAPLHEYFMRNGYPFEKGVKKGFRAKDNLR